MGVRDRLAVEGRTKIFESFYFLSGERSGIYKGEAGKASIEKGEDLNVVGWRDGGGDLLNSCDCRCTEVASGEQIC